ncbi:MAG: hypothetical protein OXC95_16305 [Dehalococcoidia bacterium]|nr:hypothetical protein [Dehalococcoidia bacterium]
MVNNAQKPLEQDLMFAVVKEKYGHLMDDEQLEEVRKTVVGLSDFLAPMRAVRLTNDIEPFSTFKPFRSDNNG